MKWDFMLSGGNTSEHIKPANIMPTLPIYLTLARDGLFPEEELLVATREKVSLYMVTLRNPVSAYK